MDWLTVFSCLLGAVVGIVIGYFVKTVITNTKINSAKASAELILEDAKRESENLRKGALIEAKDEIFRFRTEAEKEVKERRAELTKQENRLLQKEESLDRKRDALDKKENILEKRELVCRKEDAHNKRIHKIYLTEEGIKKVESIVPALKQIEKYVYNNISEEEKSTLIKILGKILVNLESKVTIQI